MAALDDTGVAVLHRDCTDESEDEQCHATAIEDTGVSNDAPMLPSMDSISQADALVQGWTAINGRRVATNTHGVSFYKAKQLPLYPTSIWRHMPARKPGESEILDYDSEEEIILPQDGVSARSGSSPQAIRPSIRQQGSVWDLVPKQDIFKGDPALIDNSLLFWLAGQYTLKVITEKVNKHHSTPVISDSTLRYRLYDKYIPKLAEREGKTEEEIEAGLDETRKANRVPRKDGKGGEDRRISTPFEEEETPRSLSQLSEGAIESFIVTKGRHTVAPFDNSNIFEAVFRGEAEMGKRKLPRPTELQPTPQKQAKSPSLALQVPADQETGPLQKSPKVKNTSISHPSTAGTRLTDLPVADRIIFSGDPSTINGATLYDLKTRYTITEIHRQILLAHPTATISLSGVKHRLYGTHHGTNGYISHLAREKGKTRQEVLDDLNQAISANKPSPKNAAKRKRGSFEAESAVSETQERAESNAPETPMNTALHASSYAVANSAESGRSADDGIWAAETRGNVSVTSYTPTPTKKDVLHEYDAHSSPLASSPMEVDESPVSLIRSKLADEFESREALEKVDWNE